LRGVCRVLLTLRLIQPGSWCRCLTFTQLWVAVCGGETLRAHARERSLFNPIFKLKVRPSVYHWPTRNGEKLLNGFPPCIGCILDCRVSDTIVRGSTNPKNNLWVDTKPVPLKALKHQYFWHRKLSLRYAVRYIIEVAST
jgi:hypothetical protein